MIFYIIHNLKTFSDMFAKEMGYELAPEGYLVMFLAYFFLQLAVHAIYYVFRSIGLYTMAKRKGIENPKRALIPFYGIYVAHKLAPESKYVKKNEVFYILAIVFGAISTATNIAIDVAFGIPNLINILSGGIPTAQSLGQNNYLLAVLDTVNYLASIAFVVFFLFVLGSLFMSYSMNRNFMFTAFTAVGYVASSLMLFGGGSLFLAGIFIFALRRKPRIDYDAYVESRRRYYNPYGNNPFGNNQQNGGNNPYGNNPYGNNPYGNNPYGNNPYGNGQNQPYGGGQSQSVPDPFEEFSNDNQPSSNGQNSDEDDFFN